MSIEGTGGISSGSEWLEPRLRLVIVYIDGEARLFP